MSFRINTFKKIPFKQLGFPTLIEFVKKVVGVTMQHVGGVIKVVATANSKTGHILKLIAGQKSSSQKSKKMKSISEETLNAQLLDLADLKERENTLSTKLQQFETELAEAREKIDQLKSTKTKTKQELRNLLGEKEQHLVLLQKCSEWSQKCDAINFAEVEKSHDELQKLNTEIESFGTEEKNPMSESTLIAFKTILKSLLKSSSYVKTYMAETVLDTEYLYEDNEELRQQLELESHTTQELTKNFRNIATDNEVLKKELKDVKGQLATKQKENQELLALINDMKTQFKEMEILKAQQQALMAKLEDEKMELEDVNSRSGVYQPAKTYSQRPYYSNNYHSKNSYNNFNQSQKTTSKQYTRPAIQNSKVQANRNAKPQPNPINQNWRTSTPEPVSQERRHQPERKTPGPTPKKRAQESRRQREVTSPSAPLQKPFQQPPVHQSKRDSPKTAKCRKCSGLLCTTSHCPSNF